MPSNKDPYKVLGLQPGASISEIKKAWQKASREHHPDRNPHPDSTQRMQEINHAYETLSDPEKYKQHNQKAQHSDSDQGYCASCERHTYGKCTHEFKFKPARPMPRKICHWCRDASTRFQADLCPQHYWCTRCFVSRYTLAAADARCCEQMVFHTQVKWGLPAPVAELYDMKQACNFEPWHQQPRYDELCDAVRDWQEVNPTLAYGLAAAQALLRRNKEIDKLKTQLAEIQIQNMPTDKDTQDLKDQLNLMRRQYSSLEITCKVLREGNERNIAKFSAAQKEGSARINQLQKELKMAKDTKSEELKTQPADLNAKPDHDKLQRKFIVLEASLASAQATIQCLEVELKTAKTSANSAPAQFESNLKDELVRKNTRITELERSLKIAKDANAKNVQMFSEAQKARKAAENRQAVIQKEKETSTAELVAAHLEIEQLRQNLAEASTSARNEPLPAAEDVATKKSNRDLQAESTRLQQELQDQRQAMADRDAESQAELSAAQKRCEYLEAELTKIQLELQTEKQALTDIQAKYQAKLSSVQSNLKTAADGEIAAKQELENAKAQLVKGQEEKPSAQTSPGFLQHRTNLLEEKPDGGGVQQSETESATSHEADGPVAVTPPQIKIPILGRLKTTQQKAPAETGLRSSTTPYEASPSSAVHHTAPNISSPRAPPTMQQTSSSASPRMSWPLSAPPLEKAVTSPTSIPLPATPSKLRAPANIPAFSITKETTHDVAATDHQASQNEATKIHIKPFDFAAYQKALPSFQFRKTTETTVSGSFKSSTVKPVSRTDTPTNNSTAATEQQASQDTVAGPKAKSFDLAAFQKDLAASKPCFDFSKTSEAANNEEPKADDTIKLVSPGKMVKDKTTAQAAGQAEQPKPISTLSQPIGQTVQPISTASKTDDKPTTPTSLLEGQILYAKATKKAAQEDAKIATEEVSRLNAQLKRYKQFEFDAYHEIARANEMYGALECKLAKAKEQPRQSEGASKIPANQFAHPVDDNDKSTPELLARLNESFSPMQAASKTSKAARKKIEKEQELSSKKSARTNRRLRETVRQKDQKIEDMRIYYGNRWARLLDNVCAKESEIRHLKKSSHTCESRSCSQASTGAVDPPSLSEKDKSVAAKESGKIWTKNPLHARCSSESSSDILDPPPLSVTANQSKVNIILHGGQEVDGQKGNGQKIGGSKDPRKELESEEEL